jgi:hypothetical protein
MTTTVSGLRVPVAGIPPQGPALSLLASSVAPSNAEDDFGLNEEQMAALPSDLQMEMRAREDAAWTRGITFLPENSSAAINRAPNDVTTVDDPFSPANETWVEVDPFAITTKFTCSPFGFEALDYVGRARRQNDAATPAAIELEFCDGAIAQASGAPNNYLSKAGMATDLTPVAGTGVPPFEGLGILQDALRKGFGGKGMIHVVPAAAPNLINVRRVGKFLLDAFDNIVIPGVGYTGLGPIGNAHHTPPAGTSWMYGTDLVMTRIQAEPVVYGDSFAENFDWGQNGNPNTITFRAQRLAMAYFDGYRQFAVLVETPVTS